MCVGCGTNLIHVYKRHEQEITENISSVSAFLYAAILHRSDYRKSLPGEIFLCLHFLAWYASRLQHFVVLM